MKKIWLAPQESALAPTPAPATVWHHRWLCLRVLGRVAFLVGHLATSGEIVGCHTGEWVPLPSNSSRMLLNTPQAQPSSPTANSSWAPGSRAPRLRNPALQMAQNMCLPCVWLLWITVIPGKFTHGVTCTCGVFMLIAARGPFTHFLTSCLFPSRSSLDIFQNILGLFQMFKSEFHTFALGRVRKWKYWFIRPQQLKQSLLAYIAEWLTHLFVLFI